MQIKTFPHEFLARWGRDGRLQGYHVLTVDIACDDAGVPLKKDPADPTSENLMEKFGEATTLERAGVTLAEILNEVHAAALSEVDAARADLATTIASETALREELGATKTQTLGLQAALDQTIVDHAAQVQALEDVLLTARSMVQRLAGELAAANARIADIEAG